MEAGKLLLSNFFKPCLTQTRTLIKNKISRGGIQYYKFKYHPRNPETFKDPPYEPAKLFFVTRIKPVWGTNPIERNVLRILNIDGHKKICGHKAVVKNIPEVNANLWKIKHLVTIVPITCPDGLPMDEDYNGTYLHSNGTFTVSHKLKVAEDRLEAGKVFEKDGTLLKSTQLKKFLRNRWVNKYQGTVHEQ